MPGNYTLSNDIVGTITISADNVLLNLNGKTITGSVDGIFVSGQNNITIKNGRIKDASVNGINLNTVNDIVISSVDFTVNNTGILITASDCVVVEYSNSLIKLQKQFALVVTVKTLLSFIIKS